MDPMDQKRSAHDTGTSVTFTLERVMRSRRTDGFARVARTCCALGAGAAATLVARAPSDTAARARAPSARDERLAPQKAEAPDAAEGQKVKVK